MPVLTSFLRGLCRIVRNAGCPALWSIAIGVTILPLAPAHAQAQGIEAILSKVQRLEASLASMDAAHRMDLSRMEADVARDRGPVEADSLSVDRTDIEALHIRLDQLETTFERILASIESGRNQVSIDSLTRVVAQLSETVAGLSHLATRPVSPSSGGGMAQASLQSRSGQVSTGSSPSQVSPGWGLPAPVVGGSLRLRGEVKSHFKFGANAPGDTEDFSLSQFRINVKWQPVSWVTLFVEGQDARIYGEEAISATATPNIFADNLDFHQGFLKFQTPQESRVPMTVTVGRQKFNMGAQRLIASLEWVNTARVWDGIRLDLGKANDRTVSAFASRVVPVDPGSLNGHSRTGSRMFNSYFHGVYYTDWNIVPGAQIEGYWLLRRESEIKDHVNTAGTRIKMTRGPWDWEVEAATQWGTFGDLDHNASMFHAAVGHTVPALNGARFGVAYNYGSGDDDPTDSEHNTFDNQFPLNHAYYGYMDFFALQNVHNAEATFNTTVGSGVALRMAYQGFWLVNPETDAWYNAGAGVIRPAGSPGVASYVGSEFDVTLKRTFLQKKLMLEVGYGRFLAGAFVDSTGPSQDPDFFYLQTKISR